LVDLANVETLASTVLSALMTLQTKVQRVGGSLVLCNIEPPLDEVFKTTRLDRYFHIAARADGQLAGGRARPEPSPGASGTTRKTQLGDFLNRPVVVCDPDAVRAEQLVGALAADLDVVACTDLGTFGQTWRKHRPAAVALALRWPGAGPAVAPT